MNKFKYFIYNTLFLLIGFPLGFCISTFIWLLVELRVIEIENFHNIFLAWYMRLELDGGFYILGNHPLWIEVFIVPSIVAFPEYAIHPLKFFPWCIPKSTLLKIFPFIYFLRALPIFRGNAHKIKSHMEKEAYLIHVKKQIITNFVEGGRTKSKREEAREINSKRLRTIKRGYWEVLNNKKYCEQADASKVTVLPVWIEIKSGWHWHKIKLSFASPVSGDKIPPEKLEETLLNL